MLESCQKFLEGKLKLTLNLQKSKAVSKISQFLQTVFPFPGSVPK